jgi:hypothetical protein
VAQQAKATFGLFGFDYNQRFLRIGETRVKRFTFCSILAASQNRCTLYGKATIIKGYQNQDSPDRAALRRASEDSGNKQPSWKSAGLCVGLYALSSLITLCVCEHGQHVEDGLNLQPKFSSQSQGSMDAGWPDS